MNIFELLNLRTEYNEIVSKFQIPNTRKDGNISSLKYFINNGYKKNRFREGYDRAIEIADIILKQNE